MRQIYKKFKDNNINFSHSKIVHAIGLYFALLLHESVDDLEKYSNKRKRFLSGDEELSKYLNNCKTVFNFELEKDLDIPINLFIIALMKKSASMEEVDNYINEINKELEQLNINERIRYTDSFDSKSIIDEIVGKDKIRRF